MSRNLFSVQLSIIYKEKPLVKIVWIVSYFIETQYFHVVKKSRNFPNIADVW